jgi:hypothetical protein
VEVSHVPLVLVVFLWWCFNDEHKVFDKMCKVVNGFIDLILAVKVSLMILFASGCASMLIQGS